MKKYFFNDGTLQQGPFTIEELQGKNITSQTPVWYDGLPDWTTAGQVEELKDILVHTPPPFHAVTPPPVEQLNPVTPVAATTGTVTEKPAPAATVMATTTTATSAKKNTAWLTYVLSLLVLGGVGYLVYQDMEKNKGKTGNKNQMQFVADSTANTENHQPATGPETETTKTEAGKEDATNTTEATAPVTTLTTESKEEAPPVATTSKTQKASLTPETAKPGTNILTKSQQAEAQKSTLKKTEEEKKKLQAAQAVAVKEMEYRNNWPKYITFGKLDYPISHDGVDAFNVPVYNATNAMLDKVTVRVDYMKKEKKVLYSETFFIYNIPPGTGVNGKAAGSKKGNNVKVFITGITSRKLHFCYPSNNGNPSDPYFCN